MSTGELLNVKTRPGGIVKEVLKKLTHEQIIIPILDLTVDAIQEWRQNHFILVLWG